MIQRRGAKNFWVRTCCLWNFDLGTYNVRTLASEGSLQVLFEDYEGVKWDIIGISKVWRPGAEFIEMKNYRIFCYRGHKNQKKHGIGLLVNQKLAGNIENIYSISVWVASLINIDKVGAHSIAARSCGHSPPLALAFELVVEIDPLGQDTGPLWHPTFHSLSSPGFPRYPFIYQSIWKDEQLGELCTDCLRPGSNSGQWICSQTC